MRVFQLDATLQQQQAETEAACLEGWLLGRGGRTEWASAAQPEVSGEGLNFESRPLRTTHHKMPAMTVAEFVHSWTVEPEDSEEDRATCRL